MNKNCRLCGSTHYDIIYQRRFADVGDATFLHGYDVCVCRECGFGFAGNIPGQKEFDLYYANSSIYDGDVYLTQLKSRDFSPYIDTLKKYASDPNAKILEIGCAMGGLLTSLQEAGYKNLTGADPSPVCAQYVDSLPDISGICAPIDTISLKHTSDFVFLLAVMEHICDLNNVAGKLTELVNDKGFLILETPDVATFTVEDNPPFQEFSVEHINYFSSKSLINLFGKFGFELIEYLPYTPGVMMCVMKKAGTMNTMQPCTITKKSLLQYKAESCDIEETIEKLISPYVGKPVIVWGIGTFTRYLLVNTILSNCDIKAIIDKNRHFWGEKVNVGSNQVEISSPEIVLADNSKDIPILIGSKTYQDEISMEIMKNWGNPIIKLF